jgi:MoaA/NifB/PqqE/SkfB family radical SAM enzyme
MNKKEQGNRDKLGKKKPLVLDKILKKGNMPRLQYHALYQCNMKCSFCSIEKNKNKEKKSLTMDQIKNLFDTADSMGISRVTITGGEPLLLSNFDELIKAIDPSRFYLQLDSNGLLLSREKVFYLKDLGIDCITPSLDSFEKEIHDSWRNSPGSYDKVLKAFDYIQEAELNTFVQTIVGKTRIYSNEFLRFIEYFNNRGIGVYVGFCKPVGEYEGNFDELIDKNDLKYIEELEKKYKVFSHLTPGYGINEERNCVASKNIFAVNYQGFVFPCIFFFCSMGNILEESLEVILKRSQALLPFRKNTCVMSDREDGFIDKYLVKKMYSRKLPVHYKEVFEEDDFE